MACRLEAALGDTRIAQFRMFERIEEGALWLEERQLAVHGLAQSDRAAGLHKWTKAAAPVRGLRAFSKLKPVDSAKEVARGHFMKQPGACGVRSFHPGDTICRYPPLLPRPRPLVMRVSRSGDGGDDVCWCGGDVLGVMMWVWGGNGGDGSADDGDVGC